jgi:hypothetical protein
MPTRIPKALSVGEETLARDLGAYKIPFDRQVRVCSDRKWMLDFLVQPHGQAGIAIEVNGGTWTQGRHSRGSGQASDYEKLNRCTLLGYRVPVYSTEQVTRGMAISDVLKVIGIEP